LKEILYLKPQTYTGETTMRIKKTIADKVTEKLSGKVSNQEAVAAAVESHAEYPEIEIRIGTFQITVKDEDGKEIYKNDSEGFKYPVVPSLVSALRLEGAKLSDDQIAFINEALKGSVETGKAVVALLETINDSLRVSSKNRRYQSVFNQHKPLTEESMGNAYARMIRDAMRTKNVSDETAHRTLQEFGLVPAEYTLEIFRTK